MSSPAPDARASAPPPVAAVCPELDAACALRVARFVAEEDLRSFALVCTTWLGAARDPSLAVYTRLDAQRWALLGPQGSPFCACGVARACARLRNVLRHLDCRGLVPCDACRYPAGGDVADTSRLLRTLLYSPGMPKLESLDLSEARRTARRRLSDSDFTDAHAQLSADQAPPLPALRSLRLVQCDHIRGRAFEVLWTLCPGVVELFAARCPLTELSVRVWLAPRQGLRANLLDEEPLPEAVAVSCGVCGSALWPRLASFAKAPPTQPHISQEWYTNEPPPSGAVVPMQRGVAGAQWPEDERTLNCARNCHAPHQLYLVDAGTGAVALHGWRYGIAVGDGVATPLIEACPRLARATACPPA